MRKMYAGNKCFFFSFCSNRAPALCALLCTSVLALFGECLGAAVMEKGAIPKLATAKVARRAVPVHPDIATRAVRLSDTETAGIGFPIGKPLFVMQLGEKVDVVDIFFNGGESGYTCKIRNSEGVSGFVICLDLDVMEWLGERGALIRIFLEQPYEYEGGLSRRLRDIEKLEAFVEAHPKGRFTPYAKLAVLSLRCGVLPDVAQAVWGEINSLKDHPAEGRAGELDVSWTPKANRMLSSLAKRADERVQELFDLCSVVRELQGSLPSPVSRAGK